MRTEDAVTEVPGQFAALGGFTLLYVILAIATTWTLLLHAKSRPSLAEHEANRPFERNIANAME